MKKSDIIEVVRRLYYACHWIPDREVEAEELWKDVRDACGFPKGQAPTPLFCEWDLTQSLYPQCSRGQFADPILTLNLAKKMIYCPYCGKPIKVTNE